MWELQALQIHEPQLVCARFMCQGNSKDAGCTAGEENCNYITPISVFVFQGAAEK